MAYVIGEVSAADAAAIDATLCAVARSLATTIQEIRSSGDLICSPIPADRCDLDHHNPWPHGATSAANADPLCRRHHRAKTFAWLPSIRDGDTVEWTMPGDHRYRCIDEPMPVGPG